MHRDISFWAILPLWQLVIYYKKWGWSKQRKRSWGVMLKWRQSPAGKRRLYCHCYHTQTVPRDPWQAQAEVWQQCKRETEPRHAGEPVGACTGAALEAHKENSAPATGGCWRHRRVLTLQEGADVTAAWHSQARHPLPTRCPLLSLPWKNTSSQILFLNLLRVRKGIFSLYKKIQPSTI